ncbi:hypothetical protein H0H87_009531 [Tephrocybe sp. NHM501043]|nr:hypothetical protein H0H87_009531 [Tephrocybe sp. NHM501043]
MSTGRSTPITQRTFSILDSVSNFTLYGINRALPPSITSSPLLWLRHTLSSLPFVSYTKREQDGFQRHSWFLTFGHGYKSEQSTRPQTLGYNFADSPAGLFAWIYEKLWNGPTITSGLMTRISIYYFSRAGPAASLRIYYDAEQLAGGVDLFLQVKHTKIPVGYSYFAKELDMFPRSWFRLPNLVFEAEHD